jgi:uncharacterized protein YjbJ (UPF0337 family)
VTGKHIDKAKRRVNEAAGTLTGNRRLKNEGRADRAEGSATNAVDKVAGGPHRPQESQAVEARMREPNPPEPWEVTMLTILLIVVVILLLTGGSATAVAAAAACRSARITVERARRGSAKCRPSTSSSIAPRPGSAATSSEDYCTSSPRSARRCRPPRRWCA